MTTHLLGHQAPLIFRSCERGVQLYPAAPSCVNRLSVAPEHMGDTIPADGRKAILQEAREDVGRAIVHLAARLAPHPGLSGV